MRCRSEFWDAARTGRSTVEGERPPQSVAVKEMSAQVARSESSVGGMNGSASSRGAQFASAKMWRRWEHCEENLCQVSQL